MSVEQKIHYVVAKEHWSAVHGLIDLIENIIGEARRASPLNGESQNNTQT